VTWLPNQLSAVVDLMQTIWDGLQAHDQAEAGKSVQEIMENVSEQKVKLEREVERWCQERGVSAQ